MGAKGSKYCAFEHASHNLEVHNFLKAQSQFGDWQITTAFYTALKFVEGALFPAVYRHPDLSKDAPRMFSSYSEYRTLFNRFVGGTPHDAMKYFVKHNTTTDIWYSYLELYDLCHNARYRNYKIAAQDLVIALEALDDIKSYCLTHQK